MFHLLDQEIHRTRYSSFSGMLLGVVTDDNLAHHVRRALGTASKGNSAAVSVVEEMFKWIVDLWRAPLPDAVRGAFIEKVYHRSMRPDNTNYLVNTLMVARALAQLCPSTHTRRMLETSWRPVHELFEKRGATGKLYGVWSVEIGTDDTLRELGLQFETLNLTGMHEGSDSAELYRRITELLTGATTVVYVIGLSDPEDRLLKWCCELTVRSMVTQWDHCTHFGFAPSVWLPVDVHSI